MPRRKQVLGERQELPEVLEILDTSSEEEYYSIKKSITRARPKRFLKEKGKLRRLQKHAQVEARHRAKEASELRECYLKLNATPTEGHEVDLRSCHVRKAGIPAILRSAKHKAVQAASFTDTKNYSNSSVDQELKARQGNTGEEIIMLDAVKCTNDLQSFKREMQSFECPRQYHLVNEEEDNQGIEVAYSSDSRTVSPEIIGWEENVLQTVPIVLAGTDTYFAVDEELETGSVNEKDSDVLVVHEYIDVNDLQSQGEDYAVDEELWTETANGEDSDVLEVHEYVNVSDIKTEELENSGEFEPLVVDDSINWAEHGAEEQDEEAVHLVQRDLLVPDVVLEEELDEEVEYELENGSDFPHLQIISEEQMKEEGRL